LIELIDRDSLYLFPRHTLSISTTIALVEILLIEIKIQNQKEVHPTTSITQVVVPSGPTEHMGIMGNYPHSLLADSLTLFLSQGADYPHCKGLSPLFKKMFHLAWAQLVQFNGYLAFVVKKLRVACQLSWSD
jgi:hypothetical protein